MPDQTGGALAPHVTRAGREDDRTGQSDGALRISGVSADNSPATIMWMGKVSNEPGHRSVPHHHGEAETTGYLLKGHARIYFGEGYAEWVDMTAGDFVFVPPMMPHVEANMSTDEELVWVTARTPGNIVVNFEDVDDADLEGFARA
jgi:uncharacterized RmlC-like cupin family protein